jgi:uncharacterized membrane protein
MASSSQRSSPKGFKRGFVRGLVVVLPSVLTIWLIVKAYQFVDTAIAEPINGSIHLGINNLAEVWEPLRTWDVIEPTQADIEAARTQQRLTSGDDSKDTAIIRSLRQQNIAKWWDARWYMRIIGLVVAIIAVYVLGRLVGGFLGRQFYTRVERLISNVPVIKQVYPYIKQLVDFLFNDDKPIQANRVVAVEYPRRGLWSVGFVTSDSMKSIRSHVGEMVTVFIPSSPTPFTGYTISVAPDEVIDLPLTVEEAIRFAVSAGVLVPEKEQPDLAGMIADAKTPSSDSEEPKGA